MTVTDYTEADRWDWDQSDSRQHCKHGTFIGSWWGPDLLCQWCEDGISDEDFARYCRQQHLSHIKGYHNFIMQEELITLLKLQWDAPFVISLYQGLVFRNSRGQVI